MSTTENISFAQLLPASWKFLLDNKQHDWSALEKELTKEYQEQQVFPKKEEIFKALELCPLESVKVVIIGQDPFHTPGAAHGLAFSVPKGQKIPPSLRNIFAEIESDLGFKTKHYTCGDLTRWAQQGVLLLNSILTVRAHQAASHSSLANGAWEKFTNQIIQSVAQRAENIVFMLWGNYAKQKRDLVQGHGHLVLESAHPSPLAAKNFFGCKHFSKANYYLQQHDQQPIDWELKQEIDRNLLKNITFEGETFSCKDVLKSLGSRWNGQARHWELYMIEKSELIQRFEQENINFIFWYPSCFGNHKSALVIDPVFDGSKHEKIAKPHCECTDEITCTACKCACCEQATLDEKDEYFLGVALTCAQHGHKSYGKY